MRLHFATSLLFLSSARLLAQSAAGLAGISGIVRDASGSYVPNAKAVVSNDAQGIVRTLITNEDGLFTAPALAPASGYKVTVTASGFGGYETKDLDLQVGQNLNLNINLAVAQSATAVEVSANAPLFEDTKTNLSQVIGSQQIVELPINGRRVDSFVLLTPGVTNDSTFGLLSFRGVAGGNSFLVDGGDTTEQYYNENAGRSRVASQLSQDAVQEFQVLSANFSAEYGRASGGVVNTVTRSGTNSLHGTAYWFFRNRTLDAQDRYATINPHEVRHQAGASAGGRIKKDKLFYFLNTDITRRNFPLVSSLNRPAVVDPNSKSFLGCAAPATPAQCAAVNTILPRYFGLLPREANQELGFGKLDWRPSERNSFSASFNYLRFLSPDGIVTSVASTTGSAIGSNGDDSVRVRNGKLSWTGIPTVSMVNEFRFGWFTDRQADTFDQRLLPAGIGLTSLTVQGQSGLGAGANYLPRVQPNEQRFQLADNASWTFGKHLFKFGADIARTQDYSYFINNAYGSYNYATVTNFAQDFSGNTTGAKHWQTYAQTFGNPVSDASIHDYGFYAQDEFHMGRRLTLTYGLRYEYAALPQPKIANPDYPQTGHIRPSTLNLAPRVGAAYKLGDSKIVLRAGYGVFHARFMGSLIANLFTGNGITQTSLSLQGSSAADLAAGPVYPAALTAAPANARGSSTIQFADPHLRTPYTEQGTLAVERQLSRDMVITASYIWSRGVQLLTVRDLNVGAPGPDATYTIDDAGGHAVGTFTTPVYLTANRVDPRYQRILQDENGLKSFYNALAVQFQTRFRHGLQAAASYTWAHAIDDGQGAGSDALFFSSAASTYNGNYKFDKGSGALDQRHRLVLAFIAQPTFTHRSGAFYKYLVNNWQFSSITTLASGRPETATLFVSDTPVAGMAFNTTLDGFGGNKRVPFWPVNSLYTPAIHRVDARLSKIVPIGERYKLSLTLEAFNVTNTIVDTAIFSEAYLEKGRILTSESYGGGSSSGGFPDGTNARRAQVGARFVF
jgi:hypothetical protein